MFDLYGEQLESELFQQGQNSFTDFGSMFFPGDAAYYANPNPPTQALDPQQFEQQQQLYTVEQAQLQSLSLAPAAAPVRTVDGGSSPAPSGSPDDGKATPSDSFVSESSSPQSSPNSDLYSPVESKLVGAADGDSDSDLDSDDDDSDSESDDDDGNKHPRKIPAKRRRVANDKTPAAEDAAAKPARKAPSKKHGKKALPVPSDPALPKGHPLPAILGGEMPAPLRRKRRKDMTEEEMKKKEAAGIPDSEDSDSEERRMVRLPRSTLLVMNSSQISQYIRYLRATKTLSRGQIEELRRQKRLVKNRESAKTSRKKREALVSELQATITQMNNSLESLKKENQRLADENLRLRGALKMRDPTLFDSILKEPEAAAAAGKMFDSTAASKDTSSNNNRPTVRVASLVFFFIVLCFALFAHVSVLQTRAGNPTHIPKTVPHNAFKREMIPEVSRRFYGSKPYFANQQHNGRILKGYDDSSSYKNSNVDDQQCKFKLPDIELSGSWHDRRVGGLTIHRPKVWAPESNLTYLYVSPNSYISAAQVSEKLYAESDSPYPTLSFVIPLDTIRPSCHKSDIESLSRKDDVLVDVRCSVQEISIIPENAAIPEDKNN